MLRSLTAVTFLVPSYDEGLAFFCNILGLVVLEDAPLSPTKRWDVVAPSPAVGAALVLAVSSDELQRARIGDQTGGRVGFFLRSNDRWGDYGNLLGRGVNFLEKPRREPYGLVAVFVDPRGGNWDLLEPVNGAAETSWGLASEP